jgi:hypothetical protein
VLNLVLRLREENGLRVFENRVLRMVVGPKREEVTEDCRKFVLMRNSVIPVFARYF